ncbi:hypothetical protein BKA56DRAFT_660926 [Ilyonectria sp. MPI-CAGE-AT-0026]|nr:hypothetical protein BKA56DRAFT_660926 [Ilyonectria sp. MPI-CAGE-AT-0026]
MSYSEQASPNRRLLHEVEIYETLQEPPHPNLGRSLGCVVSRDDRTTGLVLLKYKATLFERAHDASSFGLDERSYLGLAHNGLSPERHVHGQGRACSAGFRYLLSCWDEVGERWNVGEWEDIPAAVFKESSIECDEKALEYLSVWLRSSMKR